MRSLHTIWLLLLLAGCSAWHSEGIPPRQVDMWESDGQLRVITRDGVTIPADTVRFSADSATMIKVLLNEPQVDSLRRISNAKGIVLSVDTSRSGGHLWLTVREARVTTIPRSAIAKVERQDQSSDERSEMLGWGLILAAGLAVHLGLRALHWE